MKFRERIKLCCTVIAVASALVPMTAQASGWGTSIWADSGGQSASSSPVTTANTSSKTTTPVNSVIQNNTELSSISRTPAAGKQLRASVGVESYFSENNQLYAIPMSYAFTPDFYMNLTAPIVSLKNFDGKTETGIGDLVLTGKHRFGSEETLEVQSLLTLKFATGDAEKGLGTGSYDVGITEKLIKRFDKVRCTLMGGLMQATNNAQINGYSVNYGTQMSYMAAVETNLLMPNLWFGARVSGINNLNNTVSGSKINDDITTVDITPEIKYFMSGDTAFNLSVIAPVYTRYDVAGAKGRDVTVNFGVFKAF